MNINRSRIGIPAIGLAGLFIIGFGLVSLLIDPPPADSTLSVSQATSESCLPAPALADVSITDPGKRIVRVGTEAELQAAATNLSPNTVLLLAPGTYNLSRSIYVQTDDVTIRGDSNRCDDVVLAGKGMENPAGRDSVPHGVWGDSRNLKVQNLTIREVYYHGISLNGTADSPEIYNVGIIDTGEQFIKANPLGFGNGVDHGVVDYALIKYTNNPPTTDHGGGIGYTQGVDIHAGDGWTIKNSRFENFHTPDNADHLWSPVILAWNGASNTTVESNVFVDPDRAIAFGLDARANDHSGGVIKNNTIVLSPGRNSKQRIAQSDAVIIVWNSPGSKVLHNTIATHGNTNKSIELRFNSNGTEVRNNLVDAPISDRSTNQYVDANNVMVDDVLASKTPGVGVEQVVIEVTTPVAPKTKPAPTIEPVPATKPAPPATEPSVSVTGSAKAVTPSSATPTTEPKPATVATEAPKATNPPVESTVNTQAEKSRVEKSKSVRQEKRSKVSKRSYKYKRRSRWARRWWARRAWIWSMRKPMDTAEPTPTTQAPQPKAVEPTTAISQVPTPEPTETTGTTAPTQTSKEMPVQPTTASTKAPTTKPKLVEATATTTAPTPQPNPKATPAEKTVTTPAPAPKPKPVEPTQTTRAPAPKPAPKPVETTVTTPAPKPKPVNPGGSNDRVTKADFRYQGSFRVPDGSNDKNTLAWGGAGLAYNDSKNSLFITGHDHHQRTAEISVPALSRSTNPSALPQASFLQPPEDVTDGKLPGISQPRENEYGRIGGYLVDGNDLIVSGYDYYDADNSQVRSHLLTDINMGSSSEMVSLTDKVQARWLGGAMTKIPAAWQDDFGGDPFMGGLSGISIVSNSSVGPSAATFSRASLSGNDPAKLVLGYPLSAALDGRPEKQSDVWNLTSEVKGMVFPEGSSSVLYFGTHGVGSYCYGTGSACGDPMRSSKGTHAYPYQYQIWAYDAADLARVYRGEAAAESIRPYSVWELDLPHTARQIEIGGVAYDPATGRIFVSQGFADGDQPVIHVYTLG